MNSIICGHERETLQWALRVWNDSPGSAAIIVLDNDGSFTAKEHGALVTSCDPAKLAAIIAELMRERGLRVGDGRSNSADIHVFSVKDVAMVHVTRGIYDFAGHKQLTMHQARAFALRLLDSLAATVVDVERMIGELL